MNLKVYSTQRPTVSSSSAGVGLKINGNVDVYVQLENGSSVYTFTMGAVRELSCFVAIKKSFSSYIRGSLV